MASLTRICARRRPLAACLRSFTTTTQRQKTQTTSDGKNFRGQMMDSVAARIKREGLREEEIILRRQAIREANQGPARKLFAYSIALLLTSGLSYFLGATTAAIPDPASTESTLALDAARKPKHDLSETNLQASWIDLREIVGKENVSDARDDIAAHSGSSWSSHGTTVSDEPFVIVRPATTEEVSRIMKMAHTRRLPVTAYSGGTSLEGHFAATYGGICIDFSRMDGILNINPDDMDVIVQPAVGWETLNAELADQGLFFPPDPGPGAMIGGMVGTGCSGTNAYRYGTMRDWVLSLTVVLADGTIIKTRQRARKSSAGYDLTRLFIGSEGTLGLVTEATLKLTALPRNNRVAAVSFPSIRQAAECAFHVVRTGIPVAAIELLDDVQMECVNASGTTRRKWAEKPTLFFKFSGTSVGQVNESIAAVQSAAKSTGSHAFEFARTEDEASELWSARKEALWSVMARKRRESDRVWTTDVAVPMSALASMIEQTKEDIRVSGLLASIVGHVGDGNFHAIILYGTEDPAERQKAEGVVHRMVQRAIAMEGTCTGEHGVGLVKRDYLEDELGKDTVDAMRLMKRAWDPLCLLNCDKIVRQPR